MEFLFDFTKKTISKNVGEFLIENLTAEKERESLKTIMKGKKLQYGDANSLLRHLINVIIHFPCN